jgi:hypothetical protein
MPPHHPQPAPIACSTFARYFYPPDVIILAVRWYLRFAIEADHGRLKARQRPMLRRNTMRTEASCACAAAGDAPGRRFGG